MDETQEMIELIPDQNQISVTAEDIRADKLDPNNLIDIFVQLVFKLKRDVNIVRYGEADGSTRMVVIPKYSFGMIYALKVFIKKYCELEKNDALSDWVIVKLNLLRDELYFNNIGVDLNKDDCAKFNEIIDALTVKYYQTLIYIIHQFMNSQNKVLKIYANDDNTAYIFSYRLMNIFERTAYEKNHEEETKKIIIDHA